MNRRFVRVQKITIESPKYKGDVWIHIRGEEVEVNDQDEVVAVIPSNHFAHFRLDHKAMTMFTFYDPVTQTLETHSGAGIASAVESSALLELQSKYGGNIEGNKLWLS